MRCPVCAHDETQIVARRESDESDVIRRCLKCEKRFTTGPRTRTAASRNTVERHVRGNWVGTQCETLVQAPVPAHVIDKGIPTAGVLAQVLVAKYIAQWVGCVGVALMPLVQVMQAYETGNCQNV